MSKKSGRRDAAEPMEETQETPAAEAAQETAAETAEETAAKTPSREEQLERELERERAKAEDFKRKWYSVSAEYENYRKRTVNQSAQRYQEGRADVVGKLFPIADNLGRALAACREEGTRKGIEMVTAAFEKILAEEKIEVIDPLGQPFDAEKHEAIMAVEPEAGEESGTVKQVYAKGYMQNGKVLRFAQVVVVK